MRLNNWPKIAGLLLSGSFSIRMELDHPGNHTHPVLLLRHQATWMPGPLLGDDRVRSGMFTAAWCPPTFQALHDSSLGAGLCRAPGRLVQSVGKPSQRDPCLTYGGGHLGPRKRFWLARVNPAGTGPMRGCSVIVWLQVVAAPLV